MQFLNQQQLFMYVLNEKLQPDSTGKGSGRDKVKSWKKRLKLYDLLL